MENKCECEIGEDSGCGCPTSAGRHHGCGHGSIGMQASDPVTMSQTMFQKAFFKALFDLKVEKLKKKIEEKWGSNLDQAARGSCRSIWKRMGSIGINCSS